MARKLIIIAITLAFTLCAVTLPILADSSGGTEKTDIDPYYNGATIKGTYTKPGDGRDGHDWVVSMNSSNVLVLGQGTLEFNDAWRITDIETGTYGTTAFTHQYTMQTYNGVPYLYYHNYTITNDTNLEVLFSKGFSVTLYNLYIDQRNIEDVQQYRILVPYVQMALKGENYGFKVTWDYEYDAVNVLDTHIENVVRTFQGEGTNTAQATNYSTPIFEQRKLQNYEINGVPTEALDILHIRKVTMTITPYQDFELESLHFHSIAENHPAASYLLATQGEYIDKLPQNGNGPIRDFTHWIATAVKSFVDLEIYPGLKLYMVVLIPISLGLLKMFLKIFSGG